MRYVQNTAELRKLIEFLNFRITVLLETNRQEKLACSLVSRRLSANRIGFEKNPLLDARFLKNLCHYALESVFDLLDHSSRQIHSLRETSSSISLAKIEDQLHWLQEKLLIS